MAREAGMRDFARSRWKVGGVGRSMLRVPALTVALMLTTAMLGAPAALGALGYEPDGATSSISLAAELPHGVAIDQTNQRIYVAMGSTDLMNGASGQVNQLESTGAPTAASPF